MNIPIYRAKKIDSDEYVIGYYSPAYDIHHYIITDLGVDTKVNVVYQMSTDIHKIDPSTLAIHFSDMLDNQGNKIFASLNENGKGGDILYYEDDCQPYICEHSSDGTFLFEYLDDKTIKNYICRLSGNKVLFEDLKAIGIQE